MSIYKRGKSWYCRLRLPDGTQVRKTCGTSDRREAEAVEAKLREDARKYGSGILDQDKLLFEDQLQEWLDGEARLLRDHHGLTLRSRHVLRFMRGPLMTAPERANRMKAAYLKDGLSPATINRRLAIVRRVLNLAFDQGRIAVPIGKRVKLLRERNERHVYLTVQDVDALAAAAGKSGDAVRVLAYTGMRAGELFALREENVRGDMLLLTPDITKSTKPRAIPLPPVLEGIKLPLTVSRASFRRDFERARAVVGMDDLRVHDLRHTYASLLAGAGASMTVVRDLLGHSSLSTTSRYAHLLGDHLREVTKGLGK